MGMEEMAEGRQRVATEGYVGMVLAAGLGTRLRPFTEHTPKPLFPVFDQTLLELAVRALVSGGLRRIVVNAFHLSSQIAEGVEALAVAYPEVEFRLSVEERLLGTGGGIAKARKHFDGADVVVVNGDLVAAWDVEGLCRCHREQGNAVTLEVERGEKYPELRTTRVSSTGRVTSIGAERVRDADWGVFSGMYVLSPESYMLLPEEPCSVVAEAIRPLVERGLVGGRLRGFAWCDLGTWERVQGLFREVLSGASCWEGLRSRAPGQFMAGGAASGEGARYIGPGTVVEGVVGAGSVVGANCQVKRLGEVENCVVLPGCTVAQPLSGMIVGDGWYHALP